MWTNAQLPFMVARRKAELAGSKFYNGRPCTVCSHTVRYVNSCTCVFCAKARAMNNYDKRRKVPRVLP